MKRIYAFLVFLLPSMTVCAQNYPPDFAQVLVANGISNPTAMAFAPDGRIFVAQQSGALRVIKNGTLLATPFITLSVNDDGERGLIGVTLDPDFATNHYLYLYHTTTEDGLHNRVTRFTANGDVALAGSASIVIDLDPLSSATNHNGGAMHFGKDGKLYVAIGENANGSHAQNLETYHGKLLRLNKDGSAPADNPFPTGSEHKKRIWAYGLRNPFTFSVHPETGRILVNDVGQGTWEEINDATTGGQNFGWPNVEGTSTNTAFTNPIYAYPHNGGDISGCAITGGTFFSPAATNYPSEYAGRYFFQDLCGNWISSITLGSTVTRTTFATGVAGSGVAITTGNDGNLYFLSRSSGALYKIIYGAVVEAERQVFNEQEVSIYPNPSSAGYVNVCLPADIPQRVRVRLVDMLSREVSAQEQTVDDTGCFLLSYGKLKKGVYALHLDQGGKVFVQRVVVAD
jgi:glucose/arabinose dehydrogenase